MLEDGVVEFLRNFGTVLFMDYGDGPFEAFVVNGTAYVSTEEDNKYLIKQLNKL